MEGNSICKTYIFQALRKQGKIETSTSSIPLTNLKIHQISPINVMYKLAQLALKQMKFDYAASAYKYIIDVVVDGKDVRYRLPIC